MICEFTTNFTVCLQIQPNKFPVDFHDTF